MTGEDQGPKSGFDDGLVGSMHLGGAHVWEQEEESEAGGDEVTRLIDPAAARSQRGSSREVAFTFRERRAF